MGIDTSALFNSGSPAENKPIQPQISPGEPKPYLGDKNPSQGHTTPHNGIQGAGVPTRLQREADRKREIVENYHKGLQEYQGNIRRAGSIRADILKAASQGADTTTLFLQAAECISLMTGDKTFYETLKETVFTLHGKAFGETAPLDQRRDEVQARLRKMKEALPKATPGRETKILQHAIQQHEEDLQELTQLLEGTV